MNVTPYAGVWIEIFEKVFAPDMVWSLPTRECGLKSEESIISLVVTCHSLRGSVDWNPCTLLKLLLMKVTPYAGVWIEMLYWHFKLHWSTVTPYAGVWIEIWRYLLRLDRMLRHSLRGSVDWNPVISKRIAGKIGHSLRGSVDWNTNPSQIKIRILRHSLRGSVDWNFPFVSI